MRVVIETDAGMIQHILYSADDDPALDVITLDSDVEGLEDNEVITIDGKEYILSMKETHKNKKMVDKIFKTEKEGWTTWT